MNRYKTHMDFYTTKDIDDSFVAEFERLCPAARKRVLCRNSYLQAYLERANESEYDELDFSKKKIYVKHIFVHWTAESTNACIHGHELVNKTIGIGKSKGINLKVCVPCKRIYIQSEGDIDKLTEFDMPFDVVEDDNEER